MNKLIVFDLDGTLCYTLEDIALSVNHALEVNGYPVLSKENIMGLIGNSTAYMIRKAMPENATESEFNKAFADFTNHYAEHLCDHLTVYPGVTETLPKLKEKGYKLAVVSNKPNSPCSDLISRAFPQGTFEFVLGMVPSLVRKPDAQPLNFIFDYLDGDKSTSYYVGDSEVDVLFAKNAKVPCISCAWGYRSEDYLIESGADKIIRHFSELIDIIQ